MAGALRNYAQMPVFGWLCGPGHDGEIHIVPINDTYPHRTDGKCWCGAEDNDGEIEHVAHDGREDYERGVRKLH